jgi:hypothetical protein
VGDLWDGAGTIALAGDMDALVSTVARLVLGMTQDEIDRWPSADRERAIDELVRVLPHTTGPRPTQGDDGFLYVIEHLIYKAHAHD